MTTQEVITERRIVCAANKYPDGEVRAGVRHGYIFQQQREQEPGVIQGFLDNRDEFVTREEAFAIALAAGQIYDVNRRTVTIGDAKLFSEDIY